MNSKLESIQCAIEEGARSGGLSFWALAMAAAFLGATLLVMDSMIELYESELSHKNEMLKTLAGQLMENAPTRVDDAEREQFKRMLRSVTRRLERIEKKLDAPPNKSASPQNSQFS